MTDQCDELIRALCEDAEYISTYYGFVGSQDRIERNQRRAADAIAKLHSRLATIEARGGEMETTAEERAKIFKHWQWPENKDSVWCRLARDFNRLLACAKAGEWQPIATAPRDGTRILAVWGGKTQIIYWKEADGPRGSHFANWLPESNRVAANLKPTLWQPFPPPPTSEAKP